MGFDAITTLTEETKEPRKTIPRAILLVLLIGGGIFLVVTYSTQLVHPGGSFADESSAAFTIAKTIGGDLFSSVFLAGLVVTQFASGLAAQTSVARLLYAMGRDSVFPRKVFGYIQPRFCTPAINIVLSGVVGLIALKLTVATSTSFINFGAFTAFTCVNRHHASRAAGAGSQHAISGLSGRLAHVLLPLPRGSRPPRRLSCSACARPGVTC